MNKLRPILIQAPDGSSTSKYNISFPWPINLISLGIETDILDLNLECRGLKRSDAFALIEESANLVRDREAFINLGEFPCDGLPNPYFKKILEVFKPDESHLTGTYPAIFLDKKLPDFSKANYDLVDINKYPLYKNKPKACMRLTIGCPNACNMCPVFTIYNRKYRWIDSDILIYWIERFYQQGIRLITLLDDNLSVNIKHFVDFFERIHDKFPKLKFHVTEGFEVKSICDDRVCRIIERQFIEPKIGIESINPNFLRTINKCYIERGIIDIAVSNLKKHNIKCTAFFLIGAGESRDDIINNIKFFVKHGMPVRANIIRDYNTQKYEPRSIEDKRFLSKMRRLAYSASFMAAHGIDIFGGIEQLKKLGLQIIPKKSGFTVVGKVNYGHQTSRLENSIRYMLEQHCGRVLQVRHSIKGLELTYAGSLGII